MSHLGFFLGGYVFVWWWGGIQSVYWTLIQVSSLSSEGRISI